LIKSYGERQMPPQTLAPSDQRLGFQTQDAEIAATDLALSGTLPAWLAGTLVRVTPALLDPGGVPVRHWFDGLAMLHGFTIGDGGVRYASRFLESKAYRDVRATGSSGALGFATDPCRSLFGRVGALFDSQMTDNCNVNVIRLGERWIAMTETPLAIEFDADTLATLGNADWADTRTQGTAHPHYDFATREAISYGVHFGARSSYRVYATAAGSHERRELARVPVREPSYMHSFGLTDRHVILIESPLVVNPLKLAVGNRPFIENYAWKPERGSHFLVIDRASGTLRARVAADPFFSFHEVNAFEDGDEVVVDLVAYDDAAVIDALYLDKLRAGGRVDGIGTLRRYRLPLDGGSARVEQLSDEQVELPRIAYRTRNGQPYRYVYAAGGTEHAEFLDEVVKIDVGDGSLLRWHTAGCYPGEPVFVAAPGGEREDDGVLLSVVLDTASASSFLLVLDAQDLSEIARADAPQRVPFGFHGDFGRELN
jgi:beta,beta-carotene 9',10'-dioxygenase